MKKDRAQLARHRHSQNPGQTMKKCPQFVNYCKSPVTLSKKMMTHTPGCHYSFCGKLFSRPWLQGQIRAETYQGETILLPYLQTKATWAHMCRHLYLTNPSWNKYLPWSQRQRQTLCLPIQICLWISADQWTVVKNLLTLSK